jgi:RHS repeat-associated protein
VQSAGPWQYSAGYPNSVNGGLHYLPIGTTPDTFTWNANITDAGNYRVDAYYTAYSNRGTPTYTVTGDTGTLNASVNQTTGTSGTGYWATLGTQHFAPGKPATVTMTRGATSSSPVADAVRFVEAGTQVKLATQRDAWHSFAVGNVVQDWVRDPGTNFGLMVKASNEAAGIGGPSYQASEDLFGGETAHRPRLVIQYNEPSVPFAVPTKVNPTGAELSWGNYIDPSPEDGDDLVEFLVYRGCVTLADTTCVNPAPTYFGTSPPAGVELLATLPNDVHSYIDTTATASSASATASYRYWVIARSKDGTQSPSVSQLVQMPRPGRVLRVLTGDIADTTIANATAYQGTNLPTPDGYNRTMPGNNHGTYGDTRALLDFDTSSIPARVKVMSSELQLWKSTAPGSGATFDLHELTRDFTESQATWLKANSTTNWTTPGGDYNPAALGSLTTGGTPTRLTWKDPQGQTAKFTPAIQRWVDDPAANHGLLIRARDESLSQQRIAVAAGEFAEPALRPRLLVEYLEKSTTGTYYAPEIPDRVAPNTTLSVPVTITNTTGTPWSAMRLSYRWMIGNTDDADEGDRLFTTVRDLEPGESQTIPDVQIRVAINSTTGSKRVEYRLELELINAQGVWLSQSGTGIQPLQQLVLVEDPILTKELGLEKFFAYSGENTGSGSTATANLHTGDVVFNYDPIRNPSRGAATFLRLTHDGADLTSTAAGHGWSVQASTATRIGRASMIFDTEKVPQTPYPRRVYVIDGDGTGHQYTFIQPDPQNPATWRYDRPAGVHLDLRFDPNAPSDRAWSLTRPDGTRFYFEDTGGNAGAVQRYIVDRNGNQTTFTYGAQYGDTPLLTSITDPDGRITLTLSYVAGSSRLHRVTDLSARRTLRFVYGVDGETLTELRDGGNYDPATDTYGTPPKVFQFGYTAEGRLSSVKDPLNGETRFTYYATPWAGRVQTLTDRRGKVTEFAYADPGGIVDPAFETTVTGVLVEGGTTRRFSSLYTTDAFGRPTAIRNANNETTKLGWDRDNNVVRMEEANHAVTTWAYEPESGYPTSIRDAEANKNGTPGTSLSYATMPGSATTAPVRVLTAKTSPQGRTWQFSYDTKGNLTTVTDPLGVASPTVGDYQTSYNYNAYGQLTQVHDANGNPPTVYNDFDANGYPRAITDPLGNLTRFVYDNWGQVVQVIDARGKNTTAEYDDWGRPTRQSVPLDAAAARFQTTQTSYDLNDNVVRVIAPNSAVTTATYNAADEQETLVLPSNGATGERKISYSYDDLGRLAQQKAPQGNLTPADPDDFVTRYSYDPIGQLTGVVTPFDGASSYKTTYVYDTVGNLLKEIDPRKNDTPDPNDFTVQMAYDLNHRPITSIDAAGYAVRTQYDRDGLVTAQLDAEGNKKSFTLDGRGMVTQISVPHTPTGGAKVQRTTRYFYDENGNRTKVENPRGVATTASATDFLTEYLYDANNRVVQRKAPFDPADATYKTPANTFYEYDSVGNLTRQSEPTYATTKATARDWSTFTWFDNGLARTGTDPWGIATTYDYNELGLQTSRTLTSAAGDAARTMSWQFWPDGSQRARSDTAPLAGLHEVLVDNSDVQNTQVTGTWATGTAAATKVGYDYRTHAGAAGSTDSFAWKLRVPSAGTYEVFARCPQGAGTATSAVYTVQHSAGSTARTVNQSTCTAGSPWVSLGSYSYAEGVDKKVTLAVPASGTVVADAIKMVRAGSSSGVVKDFTYSYDVNGQLTAIGDNTAGALTDTYEIRYDGLQRVDRVRELAAGVARSTTTYGYDPNSNLASWFLDDHVAPQTDQYAGYTYDVRDLLETVKTGSSPSDPALKTTSYTYTSRGQRATETKPNGNKVSYRYIEDGSLRSQIENRYVGDAATLVSSHSLAYNLDGHRSSDVSKVASADTAGSYLSQTASFAYTPDNRLRTVTKTGANPGSNEAYAYDAAGSVTAQTIAGVSTKYRFDRNRLLCAGPTVDPAGTSCAAGSIEYNYDPFGRLDTVTSADRTVERYTYDGFDRTVSHRKYDPATGAQKSVRNAVFDPLDRTVQETTQAGTNPAKTTTFTYLGLSEQVVSEEQPDPAAGGASKTTASYTYGPTGERISQTKTPLAGGTSETSFYGLNPHTDVETLTSETGTARSTYRYTGYGNNDASGFTGKDKATATGGPEVEAYNPYRFNSKRWDPATGSYDMGFRDYSPGLNRFLTRDMYNGALADLRLGSDPWTGNRYAFAGGNPITGIEYDGHYPQDPERSGFTREDDFTYKPGGSVRDEMPAVPPIEPGRPGGPGSRRDLDRPYATEKVPWYEYLPGVESKDLNTLDKARVLAAAGCARGWDNACKMFEHWLANTGNPYQLDVNQMLRDLDNFNTIVQAYVRESSEGSRRKSSFDSGWLSIDTGNANKNWYFAVNNFQYRISGRTIGSGSSAKTHYWVQVYKRYNFGTEEEGRRDLELPNKNLTLIHLRQPDLAHLHTVGLARDYDAMGSAFY